MVLPNVEAGVEYRYVVQGTTADGTLYRSDVGSFRIDPARTTAMVVFVGAGWVGGGGGDRWGVAIWQGAASTAA